MQEIPCLSDGTYLLYDFRLLLGVDVFSALKKSLKTFLEAVEGLTGEKEEGPARMLKCIKFIEKKTAFDKGKGKKSSPIIVQKQDVCDADVGKELDTPQRTAPHILVFVGDETLKGAFIVGDSVFIDCKSNNMSVAVLTLLATYYVFDLEYPRIYSQVLGIL